MKTLLYTTHLSIIALLLSCDSRKIEYNEKIDTMAAADSGLGDTSRVLIAQLPVQFDSTDVLIFPVSILELDSRTSYKSIGSSYESSDVSHSYLYNDQLYGAFANFIFRDHTGSERKLSSQRMTVQSVHFLRSIYKAVARGYLLYAVYDRDSNQDGRLNGADLEAIYISDVDGSNFRKITRELHEYLDHTTIPSEKRIYFRTLEDRNRDGVMDKLDPIHHYYIDFSEKSLHIIEYDVLKALRN